MFEKIDEHRKGRVSVENMCDVITEDLRVNEDMISRRDLKQLVKQYFNVDSNGRIKYKEFVKFCKGNGKGFSRFESNRETGTDSDDEDRSKYNNRSSGRKLGNLGRRKLGSHSNVQRIEDELADRFKDAINEGEAYSIKEIFDMIDEKGRGTLTQRELENAFRKMNVKLSRSMCNKVFDDLDRDGNGTVDVEEFIDFCKEHGYKVKSRDRFGSANSSGNKDRSVKTLLKSVSRDVKKMKNKNDFIDHIESNGGADGFVRRAEFENSLREMDFKLSITEAKLLSRHFESQENRGKVDYDTFLEEIGIDTSSYNSTNNLLTENLEEKLEQAFIVCADTGTLDDVKKSFSSQDDREDGFVAVGKFQKVLENELDITLKPQERKIIQENSRHVATVIGSTMFGS